MLPIFLAWYSLNLKGGFHVDEVTYASAGQSIMHGAFYVNMEHPPLAKYFIGLGEMVIGETSFGARFPSVIFAVATLLIVYEIILILTRNKWLAISCAIILGTTLQFYSSAVMAMLDIYLTFFSTLLLYLCIRLFRRDGSSDDRQLLYIGMIAACVFASKYYGLFFVMVAYIFAVVLDRGFGPTDVNMDPKSIAFQVLTRISGVRSKLFCTGFLVLSLIIFAPYLLRPQSVLEGLLFNSNHLAEGNIVMVAGTPYQFPPIWSYIYWIPDVWGRRIAVPLILSVFGIILLISKKPNFILLFMGCYFLFPLIAMSLMTVKFSRYILPLLPTAIVLIVLFFGFLLDRQTEWSSNLPRKSRIKIAALGSAAVILLMAVNVVGVVQKPQISYDSEYDGAADKIIAIYDKENRDSLIVLSWSRASLMYYLEPKIAKRNITVYDLNYFDNRTDRALDLLKSHTIDFVVDYENQPRFTKIDAYQYIRQNYLEKIKIRRILFLWRMS
jgi:hypothetical protein